MNENSAELAKSFRKLSTMCETGVPLLRALRTIQMEATDESTKSWIDDVGAGIEAGQSMKEAMSRRPDVFSPSILTMIDVGETTGTIGKVLLDVAKGVEDGTLSVSGVVSVPSKETSAPADRDPVIKRVNMILFEAAKAKASDVHMESLDNGQLRIRFRIDGVLHDMERPPADMRNAIVSRVKIMAGLNIQEKRKPQDGRIQVSIAGRPVDIRVSVAPCIGGESVVMRLLERASLKLPTLDSQGFTVANQATLRSWCQKPNGMIIVTGPVGCGKTTTLYTLLQEVNSPDVKIMTVEDPVECQIEGICQMRVDVAQGVTFPAALRSQMRQDPDIIMIGEIRDLETAHMAMQIALTGHLVLTALHTNNAAGALRRLIDMGVEPFLVNSTVIGVLAQRLVRRICPDCREESAIPDWVKEALKGQKVTRSFRGKGCPECHQLGCRGRIGVHELLPLAEKIQAAVARDASSEELLKVAVKAGMITMREDGMAKAAEGITSIEDVLHACP